MRATTIALALVAPAALAVAQSLPSNAPACAVKCFTVKIEEAGTLAPGANNLAGYCRSQTFVQAYINCLNDNCPSGDVATSAELGQQVCADAGAAIVTSGLTGSATAIPFSSIPISSAANSAASSAASGASSVSSGASSAASSAASGASSGAAGASSTASSAVSSGSSAASSVASNASETASSAASNASETASSAVSGASSAAASATSAGAGLLSSVVGQASSAASQATGAAGSAASRATGTSSANTFTPAASIGFLGLLAVIFA